MKWEYQYDALRQDRDECIRQNNTLQERVRLLRNEVRLHREESRRLHDRIHTLELAAAKVHVAFVDHPEVPMRVIERAGKPGWTEARKFK